MRPKGVEIWQRVAPLLVERKALGELHLESFELLCREWQSYCELCEWCESHPGDLIMTTAKGYPVEHPNVRLRQKAFSNLKALFPKFGLTPDAIKHANPTKPSDSDQENADALEEFANSKPR